jgi:hypothetical protein
MKLAVLAIGTIALVGFLGASVLRAQVIGGQAPPDPHSPPADIDVPSPLLIKVSLAPRSRGQSILDLPVNAVRTFRQTSQYVCDKARIEVVTVARHTTRTGIGTGTYHSGHEKTVLVVAARITTGWFAQRVDVRLSLYDGEREVKSEVWNSLRIGRDGIGVIGSSSSKTQELELDLSDKDVLTAFSEGHEPTIRVLLAINDN